MWITCIAINPLEKSAFNYLVEISSLNCFKEELTNYLKIAIASQYISAIVYTLYEFYTVIIIIILIATVWIYCCFCRLFHVLAIIYIRMKVCALARMIKSPHIYRCALDKQSHHHLLSYFLYPLELTLGLAIYSPRVHHTSLYSFRQKWSHKLASWLANLLRCY